MDEMHVVKLLYSSQNPLSAELIAEMSNLEVDKVQLILDGYDEVFKS